MKPMRTSLTAVAILLATSGLTPVTHLCRGFLPENNMKIPIRAMQNGGINQAEFNAVLDAIQTYYTPVMSSLGGQLEIARNWDDDTVNASADRYGGTWRLNMYGGLARHPVVTKDAFTLVACHETGHHLGGAPKIGGWFSDWASNEGEADYYATLNCLRYIFTDRDNDDFVKTQSIEPTLQTKCESIYSNIPDRNLCKRAGMAGITAGKLFQAMRGESKEPQIETPDKSVVSRTNDDHPATQCRLDTYYQGTICFHDIHEALSDTDPNQGTCNANRGQKDGWRPTCWFKP